MDVGCLVIETKEVVGFPASVSLGVAAQASYVS